MKNSPNLFTFIKEDNLEGVRSCINEGCNINRIHNNETILNWAIRHRNKKIIKLLLDSGANINLKNGHGYTAFLTACLYSSLDIVQMILERDGCDINGVDNFNRTALYNVIWSGKIEFVKYLIARGAMVDKNGSYTPLMVAAFRGRFGLVKLLLEYQANPNVYNDFSFETALSLAAVAHHTEIVRLLVGYSSAMVLRYALRESSGECFDIILGEILRRRESVYTLLLCHHQSRKNPCLHYDHNQPLRCIPPEIVKQICLAMN